MPFDKGFIDLLLWGSESPTGIARGHLPFGKLHAYFRVGPRYLFGRRVLCVQIGSLDIAKKRDRRNGLYKAMIARIRHLTPLPIFIENVHNLPFGDALMRRGYVLVRASDYERDYLLLPESDRPEVTRPTTRHPASRVEIARYLGTD